jgi:hypothetical protein
MARWLRCPLPPSEVAFGFRVAGNERGSKFCCRVEAVDGEEAGARNGASQVDRRNARLVEALNEFEDGVAFA